MLFSNVGGPKGPVYYSGIKFQQFIPMSPNMSSSGISITSFTYTDSLIITCYADSACIPYPKDYIGILENSIENKIKTKEFNH